MHANINVSEPKPPDDPDSPLSFSMEGYHGEPPSSIIPYFWSPGWNSVQSINKYQIEVGGPLHDGDPGLRLIEPSQKGKATFFSGKVPTTFQRRENEWLLLPLDHIFGSEELSARSPAIAERAPAPYLALNPQDAARLNLQAGDNAELQLNDKTYKLPVRIKPELSQGLAGAPRGIGNLSGLNLPRWCKITRAKNE
jgi:NADH-quinone oxidoreductase subunit G